MGKRLGSFCVCVWLLESFGVGPPPPTPHTSAQIKKGCGYLKALSFKHKCYYNGESCFHHHYLHGTASLKGGDKQVEKGRSF